MLVQAGREVRRTPPGCLGSAAGRIGRVLTHAAATVVVHAALMVPFAIPHFPAERADRFYTVQILATPPENRRAMLSVYESLRAKGHLVYHCPKRVGGRPFLRLRAGVFERIDEAQAYAEELRKKEGFDGFAARAEVTVGRFKDRFRIVTTPSGIWHTSGVAVKRLLYAPARDEIDLEHTVPQISPDGRALVFYADNRIVRISLDTGEVRVLRQSPSDTDGLLNSVVRWSPDGRYIAYLDAAEWELPTRLWIMRSDGSENRCLLADGTGRTKVKSFQWHPHENRIYCVVGPTHGTVSMGGSLDCLDLDGTCKTIVEANLNEGTEVLSEFRIVEGSLHYYLAHYETDGREPRYSLQERSLRDVDTR